MSHTVEIYMSDLTEKKQQEVLEASGCSSSDNWDVSPLAILEYEDEPYDQ